ncbi:hypothetical protein PML95_05390 [Vagococcus lutrae]|uniref:Uncharacterized protein n=1 Tax=Vagococcus lutrae TaxID=81947 RepID=A0AAF0BFB1_9ENTE|nr:hypothetical protein [Vagococcus lutrae]WCG21844.1 hypothetical protein PML95_05390 [Vagococcus lutrae]
MNRYKNNLYLIKQQTQLLLNREDKDDLYNSLLNELLIKTYSSYEVYLKNLLMTIYQEAKSSFKYISILSDHKMNDEVNKFFTPGVRLPEITKYFPLLKKTYYYEELKTVDTIVNERNSYAHTGSHMADQNKIFRGIIEIQFIIRFLEFYYSKKNSSDIQIISTYLENEKKFLNSLYHANVIINQFYDGGIDEIPEKSKRIFFELNESYINFVNQEKFFIDSDVRCVPRCLKRNLETEFYNEEMNVEVLNMKISSMIETIETNSFGYCRKRGNNISVNMLQIIEVIYNNVCTELASEISN